MKSVLLLSALTVGNAFVLPDEQVFQQLSIQTRPKESWLSNVETASEQLTEKISNKFEHATYDAAETLDHIFDQLSEKADAAVDAAKHYTDKAYEFAYGANGWPLSDHHDKPHHPHSPHHDPHHKHKPNQTVYEIIAKSKYTTKLAKLIDQFEDVVELLNGTSANFTVFAPSDKAFDKIPEHESKPSKEFLKRLLSYHVSADFYPAGRVLYTDTIPTLLKEEDLGAQQRIRIGFGLKGLTLNFYAGVIAPNVFGTNGVIHGIESILLPPPPAATIIRSILPQTFSTLILAMERTGWGHDTHSLKHIGGTIFAPTNDAFKKLGPALNAYLFSEHGLKDLKKVLQYHFVLNETLYSDAFYKTSGNANGILPPRRNTHVDLTTQLHGLTLPVDIARFGPYINFRVNGYNQVETKNAVAKNGVIQIMGDVLIPPRRPGSGGEDETKAEQGELTVEELQGRLASYEDVEDSGLKWEM